MLNPEFEGQSQKKKFIILALGGLLIIGGLALGYFYYYLQTNPEKVVEKMLSEFKRVKTFEFTGDVKTKVYFPSSLVVEEKSATNTSASLSVNFQGKTDLTDRQNPKITFGFAITLASDALNNFLQGSLTFKIKEVRIINKVVYLNFGNLPNLGFIDLSFLNDQWIKIDLETLKEKTEFEGKQPSPEEMKKIEELAKKIKPLKIKITQKLPNEKIEGKTVYHYKFLIDKEALKNLMIEIQSVFQNRVLTDKELSDIETGLEKIELIGGEIWIGKRDHLPYKITFLFKTKATKDNKAEEAPEELTATISFKNYNAPVQIEVPSSAKGLDEIMENLSRQFFERMNLPNFEMERKMPKIFEGEELPKY